MSLYDLAAQQRWPMREAELRGLFDIIDRKSLDPDLARQIRDDRAARMDALAARMGGKLDGARNAQVRDGVAILEVVGPIVRRADMFSDISGATSVQALSTDFEVAISSSQVDAVLFTIHSPGGEVTGINEFAQMIMDARGGKPIWAYIEGDGASAAYWIASATERIVVGKTADVGWIGVVMAMLDPTKAKTDRVEFVSSQSPRKRPDIATDAGRAQIQAMVDDTADVFIADVAKGRGASIDTVLTKFGGGGGLIGEAAVKAKMADQIGTFETTLTAIRQAAVTRKQRPRMAATQEETMDKGFWANMFGGMFSAAKAEGIPLEGVDRPDSRADRPEQVAASQMSAPDPKLAERMAELEAQITEQRTHAAKVAATAFADGAVRSRQAMPAEHAGLVADYMQAVEDDAARPMAESRVSRLESRIAQRPTHDLTSEQVATTLAGALPNAAVPETPSEERVQALLAMTPAGQAALDRRRARA